MNTNNIINKALLLGMIAAISFTACKNKGLETLEKIERDRFIVRTEKVALRDIEETISIVGSVKAFDEATLYPRVSGKLLKNLLTEGDPVKKNQTVALIERDEPGVVYEAAPVPSTLNGIVGRIYQDSGANVTTQTPIALVVSQNKVRVVVDVPERYIGKVALGQKAHIKVDAYPNRRFDGKVYRISPVVNTNTRSTVVEILADNSNQKLKSGMFSEVKLVVDSRVNVPTIPTSAVIKEDNQSYVFKHLNDVATKVAVLVGVSNESYAQIVSGVGKNDEVITFGLYGLKDGSKIKISNNK